MQHIGFNNNEIFGYKYDSTEKEHVSKWNWFVLFAVKIMRINKETIKLNGTCFQFERIFVFTTGSKENAI